MLAKLDADDRRGDRRRSRRSTTPARSSAPSRSSGGSATTTSNSSRDAPTTPRATSRPHRPAPRCTTALERDPTAARTDPPVRHRGVVELVERGQHPRRRVAGADRGLGGDPTLHRPDRRGAHARAPGEDRGEAEPALDGGLADRQRRRSDPHGDRTGTGRSRRRRIDHDAGTQVGESLSCDDRPGNDHLARTTVAPMNSGPRTLGSRVALVAALLLVLVGAPVAADDTTTTSTIESTDDHDRVHDHRHRHRHRAVHRRASRLHRAGRIHEHGRTTSTTDPRAPRWPPPRSRPRRAGRVVGARTPEPAPRRPYRSPDPRPPPGSRRRRGSQVQLQPTSAATARRVPAAGQLGFGSSSRVLEDRCSACGRSTRTRS